MKRYMQPYVQTFVSKVMSLLFNTLSRFVIAFLPRSKCLLISWLPSLSTVILEPKKRKSVTTSTFSPSICHEVMAESEGELKSLLMKVKEESEKAGLKLRIQKTKIMAKMGKRRKQILFSWAPKSLWTVTAAMKLKDTCSLEGKL